MQVYNVRRTVIGFWIIRQRSLQYLTLSQFFSIFHANKGTLAFGTGFSGRKGFPCYYIQREMWIVWES